MSTITPTTRTQVVSAAAYRDVEAVSTQDGPMVSRREITDETAVTIAAWWQSPGWDGDAFASLASGLPTDVEHLLDQIHRQRQVAERADQRAFDCLATWALNHPSRVRDEDA